MIPSANLSNESSSYAIVARVNKATSQFLNGPDWTLNIDICDAINSLRWPAKEVVKAAKKRLQQKNPNVQLLALTLLETMVKNCGDGVHFQIVERNILQEMIKIVKKNALSYLVEMDVNVREKILVLLSSWQEAFGGHGGRYPQYYWAYEELRCSGVQFPNRSDAAALFAPPVTFRHSQAGYGTRLDEAMTTARENLSLSTMNSMWNVLGLLSDMLQAVNPNDREALKDEVVLDLVEQCRTNKKKLMLQLTTTDEYLKSVYPIVERDEELLEKGIKLNDGLQSALVKHNAIASGSPLPTKVTKFTTAQDSSSKAVEARDHKQEPVPIIPSSSLVPVTNHLIEEEEEDDFAQLAKRHSKLPHASTGSISSGTGGVISPNTSSTSATSVPLSKALVPVPEPPAPVKTTNNIDTIDFLSITLSTTETTAPQSPNNLTSTKFLDQAPVSPTPQVCPHYSPTYLGNQAQVPSNSYIVPWAQPQPQPQFSSGYPPPPWAATPASYCNRNTTSDTPLQWTTRQLQQHLNVFPETESNGGPASAGQKPFVPSYRLFEELNVLGSVHGKFKTSNMSPGRSMVGGRK
ncbi:hypothetical protein LguiA_016471 [Lonicera macranthoides]